MAKFTPDGLVLVNAKVDHDASRCQWLDCLGSIPVFCTNFILFLKNGPNPASFLFILFFSHDKYSTNLTINDKSIDGVLGTRTRGGRMVGADESTELWRHPPTLFLSALL